MCNNYNKNLIDIALLKTVTERCIYIQLNKQQKTHKAKQTTCKL